MHVRREKFNLSTHVNTSKLFEVFKHLHSAQDAEEDDLDVNIYPNFMDNLIKNIIL